MNKKILRIILISVLGAVFAVSVGMMIFHQIEYRKAAADADEAMRLAGLVTAAPSRPPAATAPPATGAPKETGAPGETVPATEEPPEETMPPEEPPEETMPPEWYQLPEEARNLVWIDLGALREINGDVAGWIAIPGTAVSYPLLQGANNDYYLTHNWKREYSSSGSVYLSYDASGDLTDFQTLVYGHHMRNETMFGSLKYYLKDPDYRRQHPSIYIVLDDVICRYDIFSILDTDVYSFVYRLDIVENHLEEEFLRYCKDSSVYDTGVTANAGDRIVSLSTCTTSNLRQTTRWVIQGVLAQEYGRTNI